MSVFESADYKEFLRSWVDERPNGGRGEYRKMAAHLAVSTTLISQVVNGDKHFSLEAANDLCEHVGLTDKEADYFLLLVERDRAGTHAYRQRLNRRLETLKQTALKLSERLQKDRDLSDREAAVYYSNWTYTGVTHLAACHSELEVSWIAERLKIPKSLAGKVMEFLLESGILVQKDGRTEVGVKYTHLSSGSPLVVKHHQNWRLQAFDKMAFANDEDLFYTAPMSLSEEAAKQIRAELPAFLEKIIKIVGPSPSEIVRCLNIDWFAY